MPVAERLSRVGSRRLGGAGSTLLMASVVLFAVLAPGVASGEVFDENLTISTNDTPTLKLEQWEPICSGICPTEPPPQRWDIGGSAGHFFVKDVDKNTLPFRIQPAAPSNSLVEAYNGNIGFGTGEPHAPLEIVRDGTSSIVYTDFRHGSWTAGIPTGAASFDIGLVGAPPALQVRPDGDLEPAGLLEENLDKHRVLGAENVDLKRVMDQLETLPIKSWRLESDPAGATHLGPLAGEFWTVYQLGSDPTKVTPTDEAGVALAAAKGLVLRNKALTERVESLEAFAKVERSRDDEVDKLQAKVAKLAKRVNVLTRMTRKRPR